MKGLDLLEAILSIEANGRIYYGIEALENWCGCRESHPDVLLGKEPFCC